MNLIENLNAAKEALWEHVGFKEDWVVYAIEDRTSCLWRVDPLERDFVQFAETLEDLNSDGNYFEDEIYTQRFYPKWVYRGSEFVMIIVDTHTDGNKFFAIYRTDKEVK